MDIMMQLELVGEEIKDMTYKFCRFENWVSEDRVVEHVCKKYDLSYVYGGFRDAFIYDQQEETVLHCVWKIGGWLFDQYNDHAVDLLQYEYPPEEFSKIMKDPSPVFDKYENIAFQEIERKEKFLRRYRKKNKRYQEISKDFTKAIMKKYPDMEEIKILSHTMEEFVSAEMSKRQAAALLLKCVIKEMSKCGPWISSVIGLFMDENFPATHKYGLMKQKDIKLYYEGLYRHMLHWCSLFFVAGAVYSKWNFLLGQVFIVGCGWSYLAASSMHMIIKAKRKSHGNLSLDPEQVAADIINNLMVTIEEVQQGKYEAELLQAREMLEKADFNLKG